MRLTNSMGLPAPFVSAAESDHRYTPGRYSVTALLKGAREAVLQRRHDDEIEQDVADMVWAVFGSAVHSILEQSQETDTQLKENYLVVDMPGGYQLSGIFDLYDDATGTVTDYKTASVWKAIIGDTGEWRRQVLCYCWMLRRIGLNASRGEIVAMLKDHSQRDALVKADYPKHPVVKFSWDFTEADIAECGRWLEERFAAIAEAEALPDSELPLCTPEERWLKGECWAVRRDGLKRAAKLHDTEEAALADAKARTEREGKTYVVDHRPGEDTKCLRYCSAREFCSHYAEVKARGEAE